MELQNQYQLAIEAIDECARIYRVKFNITRAVINKTVGKNAGKWIVCVMGKQFADKDFIKAVGNAVTLVYNAHSETKC